MKRWVEVKLMVLRRREVVGPTREWSKRREVDMA
jgi:hypothetical protein